VIKLGFVYLLAGLMFAGFALFSVGDRANPKRFGNMAFWGLISLSFLAGDWLGDLGNGWRSWRVSVSWAGAARRPRRRRSGSRSPSGSETSSSSRP
jgi:uncharacterized membrane protein